MQAYFRDGTDAYVHFIPTLFVTPPILKCCKAWVPLFEPAWFAGSALMHQREIGNEGKLLQAIRVRYMQFQKSGSTKTIEKLLFVPKRMHH